MTNLWLKSPAILLAAAVTASCSSIEPPRQTLAQADLQVREADEVQAAQYAPLEMRMAREKLESAQDAMRREEYVTARRLAEQALVDAQLASEKTRSEKVQQNLAALRETINTLKRELDQKSGQTSRGVRP